LQVVVEQLETALVVVVLVVSGQMLLVSHLVEALLLSLLLLRILDRIT
jgi:hypothetical protein